MKKFLNLLVKLNQILLKFNYSLFNFSANYYYNLLINL